MTMVQLLFTLDPEEVGWNIRINAVVGAYGTQYNGNAYILRRFQTIIRVLLFDAYSRWLHAGRIIRDSSVIKGITQLLTSQCLTPLMLMGVHVNFADITTWSVTDDLRDIYNLLLLLSLGTKS